MSTSSEEVLCAFCHKGKGAEDICGTMEISPSCSAHRRCMQYSSGLSQYKFESFGGFDIEEVEREIKRGNKLKCSICLSKKMKKLSNTPVKLMTGATAGCSISSCKKTFHYYCAKKSPIHMTERLLTHVQGSDGKIHDVVKYRTFCSDEHYNTYMAGSDTQLDEVLPEENIYDNYQEYEGEPLEKYLSDDEDTVDNDRVRNDDATDHNGPEVPSEPAEDRRKSPGPLSPVSSVPNVDVTNLDEPLDEPDSRKRPNPDDLPDISPVKRARLSRLGGRSKTRVSNGVSNADVRSLGGSDKEEPIKGPVVVKQELVENEVSSTSQRDASGDVRRPSVTHSDILEDTESEADSERKRKVCALCLSDQMNLSEESREAIKVSVSKAMKVNKEDIMFWVDIAETRMYWNDETYMRYLMLDIVKAIRDEDYPHLRDILLQPDDQLERYKGQHSFTCQFMGEILECLKKIHQTQIDHYAEQVNSTEVVAKTLVLDQRTATRGFIFVFLLNDMTDAGGILRKNLSKPYVLHLLNPSCELKSFTLPVWRRDKLKQREVSTLRLWLKAKTNNNYEVHLFPSEEMLLVVDNSVAWQLSQELIIGSTGHANSDIVFFRAINNQIINHKAYCHQVIRSHYQNLPCPKKVFFVFDVCRENSYAEWKDLVPSDMKNKVLVWSCFDPARFPVTCVVVYMSKEEEEEKEEENGSLLNRSRRQTKRSGVVTS